MLERLDFSKTRPLYSAAATHLIEQAAASQLAVHTLMQRAGKSIAQLALQIAPKAKTIWIACGSGNNGGDGFEASLHLRQSGCEVIVTWLGRSENCPKDALTSLERARAQGVRFADEPPDAWDLAIDALLGLGANRPISPPMLEQLERMAQSKTPVLCVDLPSGLNADTGQWSALNPPESEFQNAPKKRAVPARSTQEIADFGIKKWLKKGSGVHTLSLLTLKPGLFTAQGRDACGQLWFDDLDIQTQAAPTAWLLGQDVISNAPRPHASHKGSYGDVAVIGGASGMQGAAILAARAALHAGAGRVFVGLLDGGAMQLDPMQPELMFRHWQSLDLERMSVVCGCGGGQAVAQALPEVLQRSGRLVLDADALNVIAQDEALQKLLRRRSQRALPTVLTPHPLEAARLLQTSTSHIQANRLLAAQQLAERFQCTALLKGSGSIIASPEQTPLLCPTGNARLATAGTGDVLAGLCAAFCGFESDAQKAAAQAAYLHGHIANQWALPETLTASKMLQFLGSFNQFSP